MARSADRPAVRYGVISAMCLAVDTSATLLLIGWATAPWAAASAGYLLGLVLHWGLSRRFVFCSEAAPAGGARSRQAVVFFAAGLIGLAITAGVVHLGVIAGLSAAVAKAVAAVISFTATWALRRFVAFPPRIIADRARAAVAP